MLVRTTSLQEVNDNNLRAFTSVLMPNLIKAGTLVVNGTEQVSRIQTNSLKELKQLINQLSKPGTKLTQKELNELRALAQKHGGNIRVDLTGVKGTGVEPHVM